MEDRFKTETHNKDLDNIYVNPHIDFEKEIFNKKASSSILRIYAKYIKKIVNTYVKREKKNNFKTILFITTKRPPIELISAFRKQYPDKIVKVLIPINNTQDFNKTDIEIEYFCQNKMNYATLFLSTKNNENIEIYGLYSDYFKEINLNKLSCLAHFIKASKAVAKMLNPNIIHSDNIPFYMGAEFESQISYTPYKVIQSIDDFNKLEEHNHELFWSAINFADKNSIKKICKDPITKKCISKLFDLRNQKKFYTIKDCLEYVYANYTKFRKYVDKCEDIEENILFNRLNARITKLFPQVTYTGNAYYNIIANSLKKSNYWIVPSKTYYNDIFTKPRLTGRLFNTLKKYKDKSNFVSFGINNYETPKLYKDFNSENFREYRNRNKKYLLRELSKDRIAINFIDPKLFKNKEYKLKGHIDSFINAPLIFCKLDERHLLEGADITLITLLKLFEGYKNIQVILNVKNGLENNHIKSWIEIVEQNSSFDGRWLIVDGETNIEQFYASADMTLLPAKNNAISDEHYLAMKYGCVPIASRIGILNDTISDIFDDMTYGCGLKTKPQLQDEEDINEKFLNVVNKAINLYTNNPASWNLLIKNSMNYDSSWNFKIIEQYNKIYDFILK